MTVRVAINGFGRIGRNILRAIVESGRKRHRGRDRQRPGAGRDQRPSAALRFGARALSERRQGRGRRHRGRRPADQGDRHQGSGRPPPQGAEDRHRAGMHRHLHVEGPGQGASRRRRQARPRLGAGRRRRPHRRLRRQPRQADQGSPRRLQRLVHDQLPGAGRQGAARRGRHRQGLHDDDPRLHQRSADPRRDAQGSLPRPRRGAVDDPHLHRRRQGGRPRAAGAQRQARRHGDPRADARTSR